MAKDLQFATEVAEIIGLQAEAVNVPGRGIGVCIGERVPGKALPVFYVDTLPDDATAEDVAAELEREFASTPIISVDMDAIFADWENRVIPVIYKDDSQVNPEAICFRVGDKHPIVFKLLINESQSLTLTREHIDEIIKASPFVVMNAAVANVKANAKGRLLCVSDPMKPSFSNVEISALNPSDPFVLSYITLNDDHFGSGVLLCPSIFEQIGDDFNVIPSSIHEVLVNKSVSLEDLRAMIRSVNSDVSPQERLGDNPIHFHDGQLYEVLENGTEIHLVPRFAY